MQVQYHGDRSRLCLFLELLEEPFLLKSPWSLLLLKCWSSTLIAAGESNSFSMDTAAIRLFFVFFLFRCNLSSSEVGDTDGPNPSCCNTVVSSIGLVLSAPSSFVLSFSWRRLSFLAALSASLRSLFRRLRSSLSRSSVGTPSILRFFFLLLCTSSLSFEGVVIAVSDWTSSGPRMGPRKNLE